MSFQLGQRSLTQLATVIPEMRQLAAAALAVSAIDFGIIQGVRSDEDQLTAWLRGTSKLNGIPEGETRNGIKGTGRSNHQAPGPGQLGTAYDAYPWVNGQPEMENWAYFWPMAEAHRRAAIDLGYRIRWGGPWKELHTIAPGIAGLKAAVNDYKADCRRRGKKPLLDGPHFEFKGLI